MCVFVRACGRACVCLGTGVCEVVGLFRVIVVEYL